MSTLKPANPWVIKPRKQKSNHHVLEGYYPTKPSVPFARENQTLTPTSRGLVWSNIIKKARTDINAFIELCFDDTEEPDKFLKQTWAHQELQKLLKSNKNSFVAFPRGHGKTTNILALILFKIGLNPNIRIKLVCETDKTAVKRVKAIKKHIENNKYLHAVFPHLKPDLSDWSSHSITVKRTLNMVDSTLEGSGITSSQTGGRCDLLIGDDVVGRRNALTNAKLRPEIKAAWWSTWFPQLVKTGRCIYICTPWHREDLSHEIAEKETFKSLIISVTEDYKAVWPEKFNAKKLHFLYSTMGVCEFKRAYQLIASDDSEPPILEEWIRYVSAKDLPPRRDLSVCLSCDLALGKESGDYFAVTIYAVDTNQNRYVLDCRQYKYNSVQQVAEITRLAHIWHPDWIVIESVAYQGSLIDVLRANENLSEYRSRIFGYHPREDKRTRLETVAPEIQSGKIKFLDRLSLDNLDSKSVLIDQLVDFGVTGYDSCDSFTQAELFLKYKAKIFSPEESVSVEIIEI